MQPYNNLRLVEQVRVVIKTTYAFTRTLPRDEQFGLSVQMRRAALSIGLNIAEGAGRQTTREFLRFLEIARSSGMELEFATIVSKDLNLGRDTERDALVKDLQSSQRQLSSLIKSLRTRMKAGTRE